MFGLDWSGRDGHPRRILCLGAHCDDIEIGCGGTIIQLVEALPGLEVRWVVLSSDEAREAEAQRAASAVLQGVSRPEIVIEKFRNGYFPYIGAEIKDFFESMKADFEPDVIFTHYRSDRHQDHKTVSDLTWNTYRNHLILEYEIPKYDGDLGVPQAFVALSDRQRLRKLEIVEDSFPSQRGREWFTRETFNGLMRLRGVECNAPSGYAEAFYMRKVRIGTEGE